MKLHKYIIKHTKSESGEDRYSIYHLWFGFIKFPFIERDVTHGICDEYKWSVYKRFFSYSTFDKARTVILKYINEPTKTYKGVTLTRCANGMWIAFSSGKRARSNTSYHDWFEYEIGGDLFEAYRRIDQYFDKTNNKNFKEYLDI